MGLDGDRRLLELVRPGAVVPTHYRYGPDYPIPRAYRDDEPLEEQILGFQFPGPDDPDGYIAALAERAPPSAWTCCGCGPGSRRPSSRSRTGLV